MLFTLENNLLGGKSPKGIDVSSRPSANHNGQITPRYLIFHYTASPFQPACDQFLRSSGVNRTSAHLLVDRNGTVTQFVPLNLRAWHAGVSQWGDVTDLNTHSIGIEVVNFGYVLKSGDGIFKAWTGEEVEASQVTEAHHKHPNVPYTFWQSFTEDQVATCLQLAELLVNSYSLEDVLGHDDIAPDRKLDPGPAFPLYSIRSRAMGRSGSEVDAETISVQAHFLNIRVGPGIEFVPVGPPLPFGTELQIIERANGWVHVRTQVDSARDGWVYEKFTGPLVATVTF